MFPEKNIIFSGSILVSFLAPRDSTGRNIYLRALRFYRIRRFRRFGFHLGHRLVTFFVDGHRSAVMFDEIQCPAVADFCIGTQ